MHSVKVKVKVTLCFIRHDAVKAWGIKVVLHSFLTSALDGGDWSASRPDCLLHIQFNIILPSTPEYSMVSFPFMFPKQSSVRKG